MPEPEYRGNQCPNRGPGLSHTQNGSPRCESCGVWLTSDPPSGVPPTATQAFPPNVADQLRKLGIRGSVEDLPPPVKDTDHILREPRMITGLGPTGRSWGRGRWHGEEGKLTSRDMSRIVAYVKWRAMLALNGGGEEE